MAVCRPQPRYAAPPGGVAGLSRPLRLVFVSMPRALVDNTVARLGRATIPGDSPTH